MKKYFFIGLVIALMPNMCPAFSTRISDLTAEKQAKMKKLEKCQGTTKGLKIAGLSTLGLTAVGVAGNIAEAVVLNDYDKKVKQEQAELEKQQNINSALLAQRAAEEESARRAAMQAAESAVAKYATENPVMPIFETVDRFSTLKVTHSEAMQKIKDWDKEIDNVSLSSCEQPTKTSTSNDNYKDSILCHGTDKDYLFRFGIISEDKPAEKVQQSSTPVTAVRPVNKFASLKLTRSEAMQKINEWDYEMDDVTLTGCDAPTKTSTSNDNYNDTIICHSNEYDYMFRFGIISEDKPAVKAQFVQEQVVEKAQAAAVAPIFETVNRFSTLKVTNSEAMQKIKDWDSEVNNVTLIGCDAPTKTSTSNDNYKDSILCHGTDKDYLFRFGIISEDKPVSEPVKTVQQPSAPVTAVRPVNKFASLVVSESEAKQKIYDWDKDMSDVSLTYCDAPTKTSTSNDGYNDTIICHSNEYDYMFRFGRIDNQASITLSKPSILTYDAPKVGKDLQLPSLQEEPDEIGDMIKDIQKCQDKCEALGQEVEKHYPDCVCKQKVAAPQPAPAQVVKPQPAPVAQKPVEQPSNQTFRTHISGVRPMIGEAGVTGVYTEIQNYFNANNLPMMPTSDCNRSGNTLTCKGPRNNTYIFDVDTIVNAGVLRNMSDISAWLTKHPVKDCSEARSFAGDKMQSVSGVSANCSCSVNGNAAHVVCTNSIGRAEADMPIAK